MVSQTILCLSQLALLASAKHAHISFDASKVIEPWTVVNRFFGCDEADLAFYPHGEKQLKELGQLSTQQTHFRTHNLLTTGEKGLVGVPGLKWSSTDVLTLDSKGDAVYNFTYFDKVIDAYLGNNVKPYLQLGFMPLALASNPDPYFFNFSSTDPYSDIYTGWSHPPTSYDKWEELAYQVGKHLVSKYGTKELDKWYFEIWNEPNIGCKSCHE
jgi:xylan 1,4-beta-xylosidase